MLALEHKSYRSFFGEQEAIMILPYLSVYSDSDFVGGMAALQTCQDSQQG
jgi:hypothetical protein